MKMPKTLGAAADLLYTLQQQRLDKAREVAALQEQETALKQHILENMLPESGLSGAKGNIGQISKQPEDWAEINDWPRYIAWVAKTKNYECVQKRAGITSLREIWESGKVVPGVEHKTGFKLHVSGVKK